MDYHLYHGTGDYWFKELPSTAYPHYRYVSGRGSNRSRGKADFPFAAPSVSSGSNVPPYPDFIRVLDLAELKANGFYADNPEYDSNNPSANPQWVATESWEEVTEDAMFVESCKTYYHDCVQYLGYQDDLVGFMDLLLAGMVSLAGVLSGDETAAKKKEAAQDLQTNFSSIYQRLDRATTERDVLIALGAYLHELDWGTGWRYNGEVSNQVVDASHIIRYYVRPLTEFITEQSRNSEGLPDHEAHTALRLKWTKGYLSHPRFREFSDFGDAIHEGQHRYHQWNDDTIRKIAAAIDALDVPTIPDLDGEDE